MEKSRFGQFLILASIAVSIDHAVAQECSTEKVNNNCTVTIDRSYPVGVPTIQMRPGKKVTVKVVNSLPFETLSLDLQSAQAVTGTDQTAGFVTAALPNLKGLLFQAETYGSVYASTHAEIKTSLDGTELESIKKYRADLERLKRDMRQYVENAYAIYAQLNEAVGTTPPEVLPRGQRSPASKVPHDFPRPWVQEDYPRWRAWMICEIAGQECSPGGGPAIQGLLAEGARLVTVSGSCPKPPDPPNPDIIACQVIAIQAEIHKMSDTEQAIFVPFLQTVSIDSAALNAESTAIVAVNKDLGNYAANIDRSEALSPPDPLGTIPDPFDKSSGRNLQLAKFLGRQVALAVNAVNEVATFAASIPTAAQKKSIVTITVVFADPIFEVSAGAFFSTLANRSFANQIMVTQNPGAPPTPGDVVITQTVTRPTIVPFVGANWRLGHNFSWPDHRRGAFYLTTAVGLNPNNTTAEFGLGPSFSWRSVMFSSLFHWGRDVRLTQGEFVGEVWCNVTAAHDSIPKCSGSPPSPSTEKFWRSSFAFGVSVRVPSVFGGGK